MLYKLLVFISLATQYLCITTSNDCLVTFARSAHPSSIVLPTAVGKMNELVDNVRFGVVGNLPTCRLTTTYTVATTLFKKN
jgi:hypothetical protein